MRPRAPSVTGQWLNTDPIPPHAMRGRTTLIAFWSLGCEASWEHLRRLELLQRRFGDSLSIIAVHSPRYAFERDKTLLAETIRRSRIAVPIVHDPDLETWSRFSPPGWPSTAVVGPRSTVTGMVIGLDRTDVLSEIIQDSAASGARSIGRRPSTERSPLPTVCSFEDTTSGDIGHDEPKQLRWPTGLASIDERRLAISDSGHDRILIVRLSDDERHATIEAEFCDVDRPGSLVLMTADASPGRRAGKPVLAFSQPWLGRVSSLDTATGTRSTLIDQMIRPQGLAIDADSSLVAADPGAERLVRYRLDGRAGPIAGTGLSGHIDGPAQIAELAQPVALSRTPAGLAFLDAASSSVRLLTDDGEVMTTTATPPADPGLVDGPIHRAKLQRPTSLVARADDTIAICDTGNNKIRLLEDRRLRTLGVAGLRRPEAIIERSNGRLVVADTGNHRLVVIDTGRTNDVWEIAIDSLSPRAAWASFQPR